MVCKILVLLLLLKLFSGLMLLVIWIIKQTDTVFTLVKNKNYLDFIFITASVHQKFFFSNNSMAVYNFLMK